MEREPLIASEAMRIRAVSSIGGLKTRWRQGRQMRLVAGACWSEAPNISARKPRTSTVGSHEHQRSEAPNINGRKPRTSTVGSPELQRSEAPNINGRKRSAANSPCGFMYGKALFVADAALQPPCVPGRVSSFILMRPFKSRAEMRIGAPDARAATCVRGLRE